MCERTDAIAHLSCGQEQAGTISRLSIGQELSGPPINRVRQKSPDPSIVDIRL